MATRAPRVTLTVKLTTGKDDDLIDWLGSLPQGQRQSAVKHMLREAIACEQNSQANQSHQMSQDVAWLRAAMSELPSCLEGLLSRVTVVNAVESPSPNPKPIRADQLSTEGVNRREKRIAKTTW